MNGISSLPLPPLQTLPWVPEYVQQEGSNYYPDFSPNSHALLIPPWVEVWVLEVQYVVNSREKSFAYIEKLTSSSEKKAFFAAGSDKYSVYSR